VFNRKRTTRLMKSAGENNQIEFEKRLSIHPESLPRKDAQGRSAADYAFRQGHIDFAVTIERQISSAMGESSEKAIIADLIQRRHENDSRQIFSPISDAIMRKDFDTARVFQAKILEHGIHLSPAIQSEILHAAIRADNFELFESFVGSCRDGINVADASHRTPMFSVIDSSSDDALRMARLLVDHGADFETPFFNDRDETLLIYAVKQDEEEGKHLEKVDFLLANGVDANLQNKNEGQSPLMVLMGTRYNNDNMVKSLIPHSDLFLSNDKHDRAFDIAVKNNRLKYVSMLLDGTNRLQNSETARVGTKNKLQDSDTHKIDTDSLKPRLVTYLSIEDRVKEGKADMVKLLCKHWEDKTIDQLFTLKTIASDLYYDELVSIFDSEIRSLNVQ